MKSLTEEQFRYELDQQAQEMGSRVALARRLGVSAQYLGDVISGNRPPGESIVSPMGYERVVTYRRKGR